MEPPRRKRKPALHSAVVANLTPRRADLESRIRAIAQDTSAVGWGDHAIERMELRNITRLEVLRVLRLGDICGDITAGKNLGEWKCKMVFQQKGQREIGVVTVVIKMGQLRLITVEWEDQ